MSISVGSSSQFKMFPSVNNNDKMQEAMKKQGLSLRSTNCPGVYCDYHNPSKPAGDYSCQRHFVWNDATETFEELGVYYITSNGNSGGAPVKNGTLQAKLQGYNLTSEPGVYEKDGKFYSYNEINNTFSEIEVEYTDEKETTDTDEKEGVPTEGDSEKVDSKHAPQNTPKIDEKTWKEIQDKYVKGELKLSEVLAAFEGKIEVKSESLAGSELTKITFEYDGTEYTWYVNAEAENVSDIDEDESDDNQIYLNDSLIEPLFNDEGALAAAGFIPEPTAEEIEEIASALADACKDAVENGTHDDIYKAFNDKLQELVAAHVEKHKNDNNQKSWTLYDVNQFAHNKIGNNMNDVITEIYGDTSSVNGGDYHNWVNDYIETLFNGQDSINMSEKELEDNIKNAFKEFLVQKKDTDDKAARSAQVTDTLTEFKKQLEGDVAKDFGNRDDVKKLVSDFEEGTIDKEAFESGLQAIVDEIKSVESKKRAAEAEEVKTWTLYDVNQFAHNKIGNNMNDVITEIYGDTSSVNVEDYHNWVDGYIETLFNGQDSINMSEKELEDSIKNAFKEFLVQKKETDDKASEADKWNISKVRDFAHNSDITKKIDTIISEIYGEQDSNINSGTYHNWADKYIESLFNGQDSISITEKELSENIQNAFKEFLVQQLQHRAPVVTEDDNEAGTSSADDNKSVANLEGLITVEQDSETNQPVYKILISRDYNAGAEDIVNELIAKLPQEESQKLLECGKDALKLLITTINDSGEPLYLSTDEIAEMTKYMVEDYITNNLKPALNVIGKNTDTEPYIERLFATQTASALLNNITEDDVDAVKAVIVDLLKNTGLDSEAAKSMLPENIMDWITLFVNNTNPEQEYSLFSLSASLANAIDTSIQPDVINDFIEDAETEIDKLIDYAKAATPILIEYIQKQEPAKLEDIFEIIQQQYPEITKEDVLFSVKIALGVMAEKSGYEGSLSELLEKFENGESVVFDSAIWEVTTGVTRRAGTRSGNATELSDDDYRSFMDDVIRDGGGLGGDTPMTEEEQESIRRYQYAKELRKNYPELDKWIDSNGNWTAEASRELSAHMEPMEHLNEILLHGKNVGNVNSEDYWTSTKEEKRGSLSYIKVEEALKIDGADEFSYHLFQNAFKEDRKAAVKRFLEEHPELKKVLKENPAVRPNNPTTWEGAWDYYNYYTNGYYRPGQPGYDQVANRGEVPDTPSGNNSGATKAAIVNDNGTITYMGKTYTQEEFINGVQNGSLPNYTPTDVIGVYADSEDAFESALQAQIKCSGVGKNIVVMGGTNTVVTTDKDGNRVTEHYDKDSGEFTGKSVYNPDLNITLYYNTQGELEGVKDNVSGEIYQPTESDLSFEEWIKVYGKYFNSEGEAAEAWAKYQISGEQPSDIVLTYEEWLDIYGKNFHSEGEAAEAWERYQLEHAQENGTTAVQNSEEILTPKECPDGSTDYYNEDGRVVKKITRDGTVINYNEDGTVNSVEVDVYGTKRIEYFKDGKTDHVEYEEKFGDTDIIWRYTYNENGEKVVIFAKGANGEDKTEDVLKELQYQAYQATRMAEVIKLIINGNYGTGANFNREAFLRDMYDLGWEKVTLDKLTNRQIYDILISNKGASFDEILRKLQSANYSAGGTGNSSGSNYGQTGGQSFGLGDQGFNDVFGNNSYSDGYHLDFWGNWVPNSGFGSNGSQGNWGHGGGSGGSHY